jgi:hypothetical protein
MESESDTDLRQADLTHLRLQEMTPRQRAELRRRYDHFIRHFGADGAASAGYVAQKRVKKWVPGVRG